MILLSGTMMRIYVFDVSVFAQVNMESTTIKSTKYMDTRFYIYQRRRNTHIRYDVVDRNSIQ